MTSGGIEPRLLGVESIVIDKSTAMLHEDALNIYADGAMLSKPRAGGIDIVFVVVNAAGDPEVIKEFDRPGFQQSTNQEMELEACIVGIDEAQGDDDLSGYKRVEVFTDSKHVEGNGG